MLSTQMTSYQAHRESILLQKCLTELREERNLHQYKDEQIEIMQLRILTLSNELNETQQRLQDVLVDVLNTNHKLQHSEQKHNEDMEIVLEDMLGED